MNDEFKYGREEKIFVSKVRSEKEHARIIHKKIVGLDFDRLQFNLLLNYITLRSSCDHMFSNSKLAMMLLC